ncbi:MAG: GGDEF domain-containing protein [Solirubrobacterales bacterium]
MDSSTDQQLRHRRETMALSAALMFAAAAAVDVIESAVPGGQTFSLAPGLAAFGFAALVGLFGARLPSAAMAALGPVGVAMIAYALSTTNGPGDGAVLYVWPVLWEAYFFGRRGAIGIVLCVGIAHGLALGEIPDGNVDSWIDVMAATAVVAVVVELLAARNRALLERISEEARVDDLTGLLNRRGFDERAGIELSRSRRDRTSLAIVAFDLDHFKRVNDEFGHEAGDRVLVHLADCLRATLRQTDVAARVGGEEFVVLLPGADRAEALAYAERVREALRGGGPPDTPRVTLSAGASTAVAPDGIEPLLKRADMALYAAKSRGRDRTVLDRPPAAAGAAEEPAAPRARTART